MKQCATKTRNAHRALPSPLRGGVSDPDFRTFINLFNHLNYSLTPFGPALVRLDLVGHTAIHQPIYIFSGGDSAKPARPAPPWPRGWRGCSAQYPGSRQPVTSAPAQATPRGAGPENRPHQASARTASTTIEAVTVSPHGTRHIQPDFPASRRAQDHAGG